MFPSTFDALNAADLPASMKELAELIGLAPTLRLVAAFGGTTIAVPAGKTASGRIMFDRLAAEIGKDAAITVCEHYGGKAATLYVPRCAAALRLARDRAIIAAFEEMTAAGASARASVARLARSCQLNESRVWKILKTCPGVPDAGQGRLF